jgi:hypothetical protein
MEEKRERDRRKGIRRCFLEMLQVSNHTRVTKPFATLATSRSQPYNPATEREQSVTRRLSHLTSLQRMRATTKREIRERLRLCLPRGLRPAQPWSVSTPNPAPEYDDHEQLAHDPTRREIPITIRSSELSQLDHQSRHRTQARTEPILYPFQRGARQIRVWVSSE